MKATVVFRRVYKDDMGLLLPFPLHAAGLDAFNKMGEGEIRQIECRNPRNLKKHNALMAKMRVLVEASRGRWLSVDQLIVAAKHSLGLYDLIKDLNGDLIAYPHSINFESMDEDEYSARFFDPVIPLLEAEALRLGITVEDLHNPKHWERHLI